uniref:Uncharacterized protein n=1 Tax=Aegilops tauschii subsp. strangulata TaxID=200361 RepID=A0A453FR46_AEGTS
CRYLLRSGRAEIVGIDWFISCSDQSVTDRDMYGFNA